MDNVVDMTRLLDQKDLVVLDDYTPSSDLITDVHSQLDLIKLYSLDKRASGETESVSILRLVSTTSCIFQNIIFPFTSVVGTSVRLNNKTKTYSIYVFVSSLNVIQKELETSDEDNRSLIPELELEIAFTLAPDSFDKGLIYPSETILNHQPKPISIHHRQLLQIWTNMSNLVKANGGQGQLFNNGSYVVVLPFSPKYAIQIVCETNGRNGE